MDQVCLCGSCEGREVNLGQSVSSSVAVKLSYNCVIIQFVVDASSQMFYAPVPPVSCHSFEKNTGAKDGGVEQQTASSIPSYLSTVRIQNRFT